MFQQEQSCGFVGSKLLVEQRHVSHFFVRPVPAEREVEVEQDPWQSGLVGGLRHLAAGEDVDVGRFRPERVVQPRVGDGLSVAQRVGTLEVKHEGNVLEIDGGVGVDEPKADRLFKSCIHGFVVLVTEPLQTGEHRCGILSGAEGGIVVQETV